MQSRKAGFAKAIILIIVLAVVVIGVVYFTSDVQRTKINAAADQYAHWTPENIAKDPENYLNFCEAEATKALDKLKGSEIAVAQNHAHLEDMQKSASSKIATGDAAIEQLKGAFRDATAANSWPLTWQGKSLDQETAKRQIVSLSRQIASQRSLKEKVSTGLKQLDIQTTRIQEGRAQAQEQVAEIKTSREILKVQKLTADLTEKLSSIKAVLQTTISTASESSGVVTLDQLAESSATVVDESEFQAIMGK